jgi:hypothetical protein
MGALHRGRPWREQPERYPEVRYEQLARDPEAEMRRVLAFLGEPWDRAVLDPATDAEPAPAGVADSPHRKRVFTSSIGRWKRDLTAQEVACIQALAGETMALQG